MRVELLEIQGSWRAVGDSARTTIGLEAGEGEPKALWKDRMLLAEHSPIRQIIIRAKWIDLPYWVSVHLVRHKHGIEHFVRSQRTDRTGIERSNLKQGELIEHEIIANAQAILNISRKRLCNQASKETQEAWYEFLKSFKEQEPELYLACVPDCIYRGHCYEFKTCGFHKTRAFKEELVRYRSQIN